MSDSRLLQVSRNADDDGVIGRDPRDPEVKAILKADTERPASRGRAIRAKCLDCSGASISEVRKCTATDCALWPYRMGTDPFRAPREGPPSGFFKRQDPDPDPDDEDVTDEAPPPASMPAPMPLFVNPFERKP